MARYFSIPELTASTTAKEKGINNSPSPEIIKNLNALTLNILDPLREVFGEAISVNSGYRSQELNTILKGSKTSQHMKGEAADIRPTRFKDEADKKAKNKKLFELIQELKLPFDQLIDESDFSWIHVSFRKDGNNRGQVLKL